MKLRLREDVDSTIAKRIQRLMLSVAGDNLTSRMPDWLAEDQEENFRELYENYANMKFEWLPSSGFNAHVMFADFFNFSFPEFNAALKRKNDALMDSHSMVTEEELISALKEDVYFRLARIARPQFDIFASCCWKQEEEAAEDRSGYSA
ncbi:hypothetical protein CAPTEDRAFT_217375 [Capitella teleta]|uniref:Uncharacterized protein n=1 Tax=Capitella teleta TaxID=283909 RepID=R7VC95_CAPTE|nr:hypothetical protein CAPTEDRAFT_217375 [Capitella teleta]|eukprot:ELU13941.1 hypothetical protein CAPTEDRAFT_217375 [Capitella teleta]